MAGRLQLISAAEPLPAYQVSNDGGKVDDSLLEFLYALAGSGRLLLQLSSLFFADHGTLDRLRNAQLQHESARCTFYGHDTWRYAYREGVEEPFDVVVEVDDREVFKELAAQYLGVDGMAILVPSQPGATVGAVADILSGSVPLAEIETRLGSICSLLVLSLADAEFLVFKTREPGFRDRLRDAIDTVGDGS